MDDLNSTTKRLQPVDSGTPLRDCPKVQSSVYWPAPTDQRLNALVDLAQEQGERLSKADLLGALVHNAPQTGETIGALVRHYRGLTAGEVARTRTSTVIQIAERRSGRRPSRSSSSGSPRG